MSLIKRIINWFINLFKKLFGSKKVTKRINNGIKNAKNKRYLKGYGVFVEDSYVEIAPSYLVITKEKKNKIIEKINEVSKVVSTLQDSEELKQELNSLTEKLEMTPITFYQSEKISDRIELLLNDSDIKTNISKKIKSLSEDVLDIVDNYGKEIESKVVSKYKETNYITITSVIIDDTMEKLTQLEADYRHHKYNKNYYNREINKIIDRIEDLKKIHDYESVKEEILRLQNEVYTKSKDKYDLLFNTEIFENIYNNCNDLLQKVNRRIVDIRKIERKVEEKTEVKKDREDYNKKRQEEREQTWQENLLKRFKDLELARKILLIGNNERLLPKKNKEILEILNNYYYDFLNGEKVSFFFERNKTKTELMKLYNNMNYLSCMFQNQEYVFIDHINYRMEDLIMATNGKKSELEDILGKKYHYQKEAHEEGILVSNKLELLYEKEKEHQRAKGPVKMKTRVEQNSHTYH